MKMLDNVRKVINASPRKILYLDKDIRDPVARCFGSRWEDAGGYEAFAAAVNFLVEEKVLRPVKASGMNGLFPSLAMRYRRLPPKQRDYMDARAEMLSAYRSRMDLSSFLDAPGDYARFREILLSIDRFLVEAGNNPPSVRDTVNERSFALTGDEKFLSSVQGKKLLKRIKITLLDLYCVPAPEPFFYWATGLTAGSRERVRCLVVENKDTFHSLKYLLAEGKLSLNPEIHLLIYGEGKKILNSWPFIHECLPGSRGYKFFYFGDLDPEGVAICAGLISAAATGDIDAAIRGPEGYPAGNPVSATAGDSSFPGVEVLPAEPLYDLLLATGKSRPVNSDQSRITPRCMKPFFELCTRGLKERIDTLWEGGRVIPQEALTASMLAAKGCVDLCPPLLQTP